MVAGHVQRQRAGGGHEDLWRLQDDFQQALLALGVELGEAIVEQNHGRFSSQLVQQAGLGQS